MWHLNYSQVLFGTRFQGLSSSFSDAKCRKYTHLVFSLLFCSREHIGTLGNVNVCLGETVLVGKISTVGRVALLLQIKRLWCCYEHVITQENIKQVTHGTSSMGSGRCLNLFHLHKTVHFGIWGSQYCLPPSPCWCMDMSSPRKKKGEPHTETKK